MAAITLGTLRHREWPVNGKARVVRAQARLTNWRPGNGVHIEQMGFVAQTLKAMGKALGNEQGAVVIFAQLSAMPMQESG